MPNTVLLGKIRCDGAGHDGCQADCRLYWKEAWLRRVGPGESASGASDPAEREALMKRIGSNTKRTIEVDGQVQTRYVCQATELNRASRRLKITDVRGYTRVYTSGNVGLWKFMRVMARAAVEEPMRKFHITPYVFVAGTNTTSPREPALNLQPGDWVQVKSREEIAATLTPQGRNRGLWFDREMLPYCGGIFRVKQRVTRFIDDRAGGKMVELTSDCLTLENVVCSGVLSPVRWFCPREIQSFWREAWLRRVPTGGSGFPVETQHIPEGHHAGAPQLGPAEGGAAVDAG